MRSESALDIRRYFQKKTISKGLDTMKTYL